MNKEMLTQLMKERDLTYPEFLRRAQANTISTKWGAGVSEPYSLEPYRIEMLGNKPGRFLKKGSEPAPNRYCYSYDDKGRVIHMVKYASLGGPPEDRTWIHGDDFYEYGDGYAVRYVFGNAFRESPESKLTRIVWMEIDSGNVRKSLQLENEKYTYTETHYHYDGEEVDEIRDTWPYGPYPDRVLKITRGMEGIKIVEVRDRKEIPVYPE